MDKKNVFRILIPSLRFLFGSCPVYNEMVFEKKMSYNNPV